MIKFIRELISVKLRDQEKLLKVEHWEEKHKWKMKFLYMIWY